MNRLEVKGEMWGRTAYAICGEWNRTKSMALTGCFAAKILGSSAGSAHSGEWGGVLPCFTIGTQMRLKKENLQKLSEVPDLL